MKNKSGIISCILLVAFSCMSCKEAKVASENTDEIYLRLAKKILDSMNISTEKGTLNIDENNEKFKKFLVTSDPCFSILTNKDFQTVLYLPKVKDNREIQFGGEIWIFIDRNTKKVLYVHQGK